MFQHDAKTRLKFGTVGASVIKNNNNKDNLYYRRRPGLLFSSCFPFSFETSLSPYFLLTVSAANSAGFAHFINTPLNIYNNNNNNILTK